MRTIFVAVTALGIATAPFLARAGAQTNPEIAVRQADSAWAVAMGSNNVDRVPAFYDANAVFVGTNPPAGLGDSAVEASNARLMAASTPAALVAVTQTIAILALPRERVSNQSVPALFAVGTADELVQNSRRMAAWWPRARLLEVPGVDHGGVERSPEVLAAIRQHLCASR